MTKLSTVRENSYSLPFSLCHSNCNINLLYIKVTIIHQFSLCLSLNIVLWMSSKMCRLALPLLVSTCYSQKICLCFLWFLKLAKCGEVDLFSFTAWNRFFMTAMINFAISLCVFIFNHYNPFKACLSKVILLTNEFMLHLTKHLCFHSLPFQHDANWDIELFHI